MFVRGRSKGRSKNPKQNSQGKNASQPGRKRSKSRKRVCYNCGNTGHFIKDCPHPKKTEHASVAVDKCDLGDILMVCDHVNSVRNSLSEHEWLIDSGCTYHMSPFRDLFSTYELCDSGYVSLADNKRCNVLGDILMVCDHVNSVRNSLSEHEWLIDSGCTYHMSPFRDLFSTYELCDSGYVSLVDNKRCNVLGVGDICLKFSYCRVLLNLLLSL
ncbi:unnamed protein product [Cuscuta epithymum]|uniref:CCHC-type domain-containing protein n=1 Tax=Cuscuta epithymum TaxID=186058 RepID=A0AAV0FPT0_9ASTE|nr:unnamed protein product [Cuscuta epithymum]CAH9137543.1 unnamed protein product [Cuscuta epithymum]